MDYERMRNIYNYVYSTKAKSPEREARVEALSDTDRAALYDFDIGLLSGRIKKPEKQTKQSEVNNMSKTKKIESYEDFKKLVQSTKGYFTLRDFHQNHPDLYDKYSEQLQKDRNRGLVANGL